MYGQINLDRWLQSGRRTLGDSSVELSARTSTRSESGWTSEVAAVNDVVLQRRVGSDAEKDCGDGYSGR